MKILCIHQGYELYGSDRSFALSIKTLREMYPQALIHVMIPKSGAILEILEDCSDKIIINERLAVLRKKELKTNPLAMILKIIKGIISAYKTSKDYDVIYVNTVVVLDYILASRFMKTPSILHIREIPTGIQKSFFNKIINFSKMKIIFNSKNTAQAFDLDSKLSTKVILNGVRKLSIKVENEYKKASPNINILLIGRLTEWKGQKFFLDAVNNNASEEDLKKIKIKIVGEVFEDQFQYKENLIEFVNKNNLQNIVEFKNFVNNPITEYAWSDIVIVPSIKPEPFGRVAIEAMSMGKYVIAANHGGLSEIILDDIDGFLFEPSNEFDLYNKIKKILNLDDKTLKNISDNAQKNFEEKFSEKIYQNNFKTTINKFMKEYK